MSDNKNIIHHTHIVTKEQRALIKEQKPCVIWFTGLSGSGKSTIANALELRLWERKKHTYLLDGDNVRLGLNRGLTFSDEDRVENIRRIGEVSKLFVDAGIIVLTAFISPFREEREKVRSILQEHSFIEVFVDTPLSICENRDPKGLYQKAREGGIVSFTGISSPYETPKNPEITLATERLTVEECVEKVLQFLVAKGYLDA